MFRRRRLGRTLVPLTAALGALALAVPAHADVTADGTGVSFTVHVSPAGVADGAGEPSIGASWKSGNTLFQAGTQTDRVSFADGPGATRATWTKATAPTALTSFDPILFTDSVTGRTVESQLVSSAFLPGAPTGVGCSLSEYTDDDGQTWVPSEGCSTPALYDHQTVGGGAFTNPTRATTSYPRSFYYCSQGEVTALCGQSTDGGLTYGPGTAIYPIDMSGNGSMGGCLGLHGHIRVAPDGSAYVPNSMCGGPSGHQAVAATENDGQSYTVRPIPDAAPNPVRSDPSVAAGAGNTLYFAYEAGDGTIRAAVSPGNDAAMRHGKGWLASQDLGAPLGVKYGVFPAVIAGDDDRAAVAFLGSTVPAADPKTIYEDKSYPGVWHLYVATTTDRGASWHTTDVTPNDPVQRGCIYWGNSTCTSAQRNLLDFFDITLDRSGRVLVGYADGCTGTCVTTAGPASANSGNTESAKGTIARQQCGPALFAAGDATLAAVCSAQAAGAVSAVVPEAPYLPLVVLAGGGVAALAVVRRRRQHAAGA